MSRYPSDNQDSGSFYDNFEIRLFVLYSYH